MPQSWRRCREAHDHLVEEWAVLDPVEEVLSLIRLKASEGSGGK